jgi:hypothetical protein
LAFPACDVVKCGESDRNNRKAKNRPISTGEIPLIHSQSQPGWNPWGSNNSMRPINWAIAF